MSSTKQKGIPLTNENIGLNTSSKDQRGSTNDDNKKEQSKPVENLSLKNTNENEEKHFI
jgi:hypothetical protein